MRRTHVWTLVLLIALLVAMVATLYAGHRKNMVALDELRESLMRLERCIPNYGTNQERKDL